jgi:conjugative relaxase-like TrwC/TraI family protein
MDRVISIGNVVAVRDGVRYFHEAIADNPADYYAARGEAAGVWRGMGAEQLGLVGPVRREDFTRILEGRHPATGEKLGRHHGKRKNVAFDVTFSVPKSVSLLYALGDDQVQQAVLRALDAGADAAHGYIVRHAAWGRALNPATGSVERIRAHVATASFVHRTARPVTRDGVVTVDPQLHVHLVVASFVLRASGVWGQLDSAPLYSHAAAAGAIGQAATRDVLVRELGVRVRTRPNGTFQVEGFSEEQLAEFSQRHRQALAAAAAAGITSLHGEKVAVLDSRESKSAIEPGTDHFARWRERAAEVGLSPSTLQDLLDAEPVRELRWFDVQTAQQVVGRHEGGLTAHASVFTRRDLIRSLAAHAPLGMRPEPIEELADAILADPSVSAAMVPKGAIGDSPEEAMRRWVGRGLELHYSTPEVVALERRMLTSAVARQHDATCVLPSAEVKAAVDNVGVVLTGDQRAMVVGVCTSAAGVVVVEGAAGTGKTTAVRVIRDIHADAGVAVIGCAPSGRAAVSLEEEARVPTFTTASLLRRLRGGEHLARGGLVIADECSMLGPDLAELVLRAEQDGTKLVLIGDSEQLQPIDGGALFTSLGDRLGRISLTEVVRQQERWDREVLMALRAGDATPLVRRYLEEGRVTECADQPSRIATMAAHWVTAASDGDDVITVARERVVVAELNAVTRGAAVRAGLVEAVGVRRACLDRVGAIDVSLGSLEFAVGDRILLVGANDRRRGLVKGLRGTVIETGGDGTLVLETPARQRVTVPPDYAGVSHGYALTAHRAQGATADVALVHGTDAADRQWQYVALSRHRIRAAYYDVALTRADLDGVHHEHSVDTAGLEERLVAALSRDGSKPTTLDYPGAYDRQLLAAHVANGPAGGVGAAPTEAQLAILRDHVAMDDLPPAATWVHASLVIDGVLGTPEGEQARVWLREAGAPPDESGRAVAVAIADVAASRGVSRIRDARPSEAVHGPGRGVTPRGVGAPRRGASVGYPPADPEMVAHPEPQTVGRGIG